MTASGSRDKHAGLLLLQCVREDLIQGCTQSQSRKQSSAVVLYHRRHCTETIAAQASEQVR